MCLWFADPVIVFDHAMEFASGQHGPVAGNASTMPAHVFPPPIVASASAGAASTAAVAARALELHALMSTLPSFMRVITYEASKKENCSISWTRIALIEDYVLHQLAKRLAAHRQSIETAMIALDKGCGTLLGWQIENVLEKVLGITIPFLHHACQLGLKHCCTVPHVDSRRAEYDYAAFLEKFRPTMDFNPGYHRARGSRSEGLQSPRHHDVASSHTAVSVSLGESVPTSTPRVTAVVAAAAAGDSVVSQQTIATVSSPLSADLDAHIRRRSRSPVRLHLDRAQVDFASHHDQAREADLSRSMQTICDFLYQHRFKLEALFSYFDRDGTGDISVEKFSEGIRSLNLVLETPLSEEDILLLLQYADKNHDGLITHADLLHSFQFSDPIVSAAVGDSGVTVVGRLGVHTDLSDDEAENDSDVEV